MGQYTEGQRLQGSDGHVYVVRNGVPVLETPGLSKPLAAPTGFRWTANGQLEVIPGGPADKTAPSTPPTGYRFKPDGQSLEAIPGGPADTEAQTPGDTTKSGSAYLKTLDPGLAGQVLALAEGRRAFPTGTALKDPAIRELIAAATQYDPTLDAANSATRVKTRLDFTSGPARRNITSLNAALGHLEGLWSAGQELNNRSIPGWNAIANTFGRETGDASVQDALQKFNLDRNAVAGELATVFKGGNNSDAEIKTWFDKLSPNMSPVELRASMDEGVRLLNSRLSALGDAYQAGMSESKDPLTFLSPHAQSIYTAFGPGGSGVIDGAAPTGGPPMSGGNGPNGGPPVTPFTSPENNGTTQHLATGQTRHVPVGPANFGLNALVQRQRPYDEVVAWAQSQNIPPPTPRQYAAALTWQKTHPNIPYSGADIYRDVPTTTLQRAAAGPLGGYAVGAGDALTAGYSDELAGLASELTGGDYRQARDAFNARKNILAAQNPNANLVGNFTGGAIGLLAPEALAAKFAPGAAAAVPRMFGKFAPAAGDVAYGALYGSGENNDNRVGGAIENGLLAPAVGGLARSGTRGVANVISPPEGAFGPTYAQGVFPTIGQRFGRSGIAGRAINAGEQALQSVPLLGSMVATARQAPRDAFQRGGFNEALGEIGQQLPANVGPGTEAHSVASGAFGDAYDQARSGMQFLPDEQYLADEKAFNAALGDGTLDATQAGQVRQRINTVVGSRLGSTAKQRAAGALQGDAYKNAASDLAATQRQWAKTDPLKADALGNYLTILDDAARRNSDLNAVAALDQADRGYAKLVRLQRASELGGVAKDDGTFTPNNLLTAVKQTGGGVRSGPYLRGDALMQDYANAGRGLSDTLPNSGTADRLLTARGLGMEAGGTAAAGYAALHAPGALAVFAPYAPGLRMFASRAIAPRQYTLPPNLAGSLDALGAQVQNRAPLVGKLAVAPALQWWEQP